jgi:hypothetical protein
MALGNLTASTAKAVITYVKSDTTINYVDPSVDVLLDYDSKNKEFLGENGETVTLSDAFSRTVVYSRAFTESVTVAEEFTLAVQYNLAFTESISSTEAFSWTSVQNIAESIGTGDTPGIGDIFHENPTDGISVSDTLVFFHDGMLNTNMLNTRLISVGSQEITGDDVTITHTIG